MSTSECITPRQFHRQTTGRVLPTEQHLRDLGPSGQDGQVERAVTVCRDGVDFGTMFQQGLDHDDLALFCSGLQRMLAVG